MRLIDADATIDDIKRAYCAGCDNYGGLRCRACPTDDAMDMVDDAPTVCVASMLSLNALRDAAYRDALERGLWRPDDTPMDGAQMIRSKAMELIQESVHGEMTETLVDALADVVVWALSFAGKFEIDLDAAVRRKMASDKGCAQGHGKE